MEHELAEKIVELMLRHGRELDESVRIVQSAASDGDFATYRKAVGSIMGTMLLEVMNPIFEEHPDLKPPQLR